MPRRREKPHEGTSPKKAPPRYTLAPPRPDNPAASLGHFVSAALSKDVVAERTSQGKPSHSSQQSFVALVERGSEIRSFHVENADKATVTAIIQQHIAREARLHTDGSKLYRDVLQRVAANGTVKPSAGEYVRG